MDLTAAASPSRPAPARELLAVFLAVLAVYVVVTPQTSQAYRHFVYMALAFLDGRVDLRGLPDYYQDILHLGGRVYAPFLPVPALILMPIVAIGGEATDQGRVGQVVAALAAAVFVAALGRMGCPRGVRLFCGAALAFGSVLWPSAAIGTTWFFAQEVALLVTALLAWELAGAARPGVLGGLMALGFLSRQTLLPALPALALIAWHRHRRVSAALTVTVVAGFGVLVYAWYNVLRFGNPLEMGYRTLVLGVPSAETVARWGFFNVRYVAVQLHTMFLRLPEIIAGPPFLKPSPWGMSLLLTSPIIVRLLFTRADRRVWWPWLALIGSTIAPMLFYFSTGWVQFGYRYSLDWWIYALVLVALALEDRPRPVDYALLVAGIAVNAVGVYWVRALGW